MPRPDPASKLLYTLHVVRAPATNRPPPHHPLTAACQLPPPSRGDAHRPRGNTCGAGAWARDIPRGIMSHPRRQRIWLIFRVPSGNVRYLHKLYKTCSLHDLQFKEAWDWTIVDQACCFGYCGHIYVCGQCGQTDRHCYVRLTLLLFIISLHWYTYGKLYYQYYRSYIVQRFPPCMGQ
jgi:hypothetical protein